MLAAIRDRLDSGGRAHQGGRKVETTRSRVVRQSLAAFGLATSAQPVVWVHGRGPVRRLHAIRWRNL